MVVSSGTPVGPEGDASAPSPPPRRTRRRVGRRRLVVAILVAAARVAGTGSLGVGAYAWSPRTASAWCVDNGGRTPDAYPTRWDDDRPEIAAAYHWSDYEDVRLPSRTPGIDLAAWWSPPVEPETRVVIVVHGRNSCRRDPVVLVRAGMLRSAGFGVLVLDLRDHGDSPPEGGHFSGIDDAPGVLGEWDWVGARGHPAAAVGLLGISMGTGATMIAMADEPALAALWLDSPFGDMRAQLESLARNDPLGWVLPGFMIAAQVLAGDDYARVSPDRILVPALAGRPLAITHGLLDTTILPERTDALVTMLARAGEEVVPWWVPGAAHVESAFLVPDEYRERMVEFFRSALTGPQAGPPPS